MTWGMVIRCGKAKDHRRIAQHVSSALKRRIELNPTLVHHGLARASRWHVVTANKQVPIADLYRMTSREAARVAEELATVIRVPVLLLSNRHTPARLDDHVIVRSKGGHLTHGPRSNPTPRPQVGEVWTHIITGIKCEVKAVRGFRIEYLELGSGRRLHESVSEFMATHRPPRSTSPRVNPKGRKNPAEFIDRIEGKGGWVSITRTGSKVWVEWDREGTGSEEGGLYQAPSIAAARDFAAVWTAGGGLGAALAALNRKRNPSRSHVARRRRSATRRGLNRKTFRAASRAARLTRYGAIPGAAAKPIHYLERSRARRHPNPKGRFAIREVQEHAGGMSNRLATVFEVYDTTDDHVVMRTYNKRDANTERAYRNKFDPRGAFTRVRSDHPTRRNPGGSRIVYNKLLGGWYVVVGPHQTPLNGRFNSKAEAQAWLSGAGRRNPRDIGKDYAWVTYSPTAFGIGGGKKFKIESTDPKMPGERYATILEANRYVTHTGEPAGSHAMRFPWSRTGPHYPGRAPNPRGRKNPSVFLKPADPRTKPTIQKAGKRKWNVLLPKGIDELGNHHFSVVSTHGTKPAALKALAYWEAMPGASWNRTAPGRRGRNPIPRSIDKRSVKTVGRGKKRVLIGCPKGNYSTRTKRCRIGTRAIDAPGRRARKGPRKARARRNPRSPVEAAKAVHLMWQDRDVTQHVRRVRHPMRVPKAVASLGKLAGVIYDSNKYDGKKKRYEHRFKRPLPELTAGPDGRLHIVGGGYKTTADGLVN